LKYSLAFRVAYGGRGKGVIRERKGNEGKERSRREEEGEGS